MARVKMVVRKMSNEIKTKKPKKDIIKKKNTSVKKAKKEIKKKKENKIVIAPRLQLEPRLAHKQVSKELSKIKEQSNSVESNEAKMNSSINIAVHEGINLRDTNYFNGQGGKNLPSESYNAANNNKYKSEDETEYNEIRRNVLQRKKTPLRLTWWKDRELMDLATGLQSYGFRETKKIADLVKTRNEHEIRDFIKRRSLDLRYAANPQQREGKGRPKHCWAKVHPAHLPIWPNVRKWRRLAYEQMLTHSRIKDYSRPVLISMFQKFYEEEEEPSDPQVINTKSIYKYLLDCIAGEIPAQLRPKESALMLDILKDLRLMPLVCDFEEEKNFLENYTEATRYKPFEIKSEFKKKFCKDNPEELFNKNSVAVPEEVFTNLSRHKKLVQTFNPLAVPVWMLQKEQEILEQLI